MKIDRFRMQDSPDATYLKLVERKIDGNGERALSRHQAEEGRLAVGERTSILVEMLSVRDYLPLWDKQILEIECGSGHMLQSMLDLGALEENLYGVDLNPGRIADARRRFPKSHLFCEYIEDLNFHDARFDLVICSSVFGYVSDSIAAAKLAAEIHRILQPGGAVIWYDLRYPNPRNRNVRAVRKPALRRLFGGCEMALQSCTLLPPLARSLGRYGQMLYPLLAALPILRSHYAGLIIPRSPIRQVETEGYASP